MTARIINGKCSCGGEIEVWSYALICKMCGYEYQTSYNEMRDVQEYNE